MTKKPKRPSRSAPNRARRPIARRPRTPPSVAVAALDLHRCEQFLIHEARLLDDGKFDDWLALFTAEAWYWVPSEPDQADPHETVSLIYDDRRLLETRVRRLASPRMYSQEPRSRTSRIVADVTIEANDRSSCTVRSKFIMVA
jgi:3-phenylpropionate/cinnamic acid dioxygenase small subunit